jgi:hypothetical protein
MTRTVKLMVRPIGNSSAARMIDAAPDDATKALERTMRTLYRIANWAEESPTPHQRAARDAWYDVASTEAGAALIRQAEERDDANE